MAVSKAQQRAVNKYMQNNYDRINLTVPKGQKDIIKAIATEHGQSVNGFLQGLIDKAIAEYEQERGDSFGISSRPDEG